MLTTGTAAAVVTAGPVATTTMRIRITCQTVALKRLARIGEVLDVGHDEGHLLLGLGKAERVEPSAGATAPARKPSRSRKVAP